MIRAFTTLFLAFLAFSASAIAADGDTAPVGPDKPALREVAGKAKVTRESIDDSEVRVLDGRVRAANGFPKRTGVVAAGLGLMVMPPPVVEVEERPIRGDRGFRVER